jgi:hypothetical protein
VCAEIRTGRARQERKLAVCAGTISLSPEDRAELLVILTEDADGDIAERAAESAQNVTAETYISALGRADADPRLFRYCAAEMSKTPGIADALAKNPACPRDLVAKGVAELSSAGIHALLEDLDGTTMSSVLPDALAGATHATMEQKELIGELNQGLPDEDEVLEAVEAAEPHPERRMTLIQQITKMNVVQRIQLAIKGPREARTALIRDRNKIIQRAVLQSPKLNDRDVENFAAMTNLSAETLRAISMTRGFIKNYTVAKNLTFNPKTPLDISLRLLQRLTPADVKQLSGNKNVPETLRAMATKLMRQRNVGKKSD